MAAPTKGKRPDIGMSVKPDSGMSDPFQRDEAHEIRVKRCPEPATFRYVVLALTRRPRDAPALSLPHSSLGASSLGWGSRHPTDLQALPRCP
jgi:hypothetical protein